MDGFVVNVGALLQGDDSPQAAARETIEVCIDWYRLKRAVFNWCHYFNWARSSRYCLATPTVTNATDSLAHQLSLSQVGKCSKIDSERQERERERGRAAEKKKKHMYTVSSLFRLMSTGLMTCNIFSSGKCRWRRRCWGCLRWPVRVLLVWIERHGRESRDAQDVYSSLLWF